MRRRLFLFSLYTLQDIVLIIDDDGFIKPWRDFMIHERLAYSVLDVSPVNFFPVA